MVWVRVRDRARVTLRDAVSAVFSVGVLAVCGSTRGAKWTHGAARTRCGGCAHWDR